MAFKSAISTYWVATKYNVEKFFINIAFHYFNEYPYLKPFMPTVVVFGFGQEVVQKIILKIKKNPYYGKFSISSISKHFYLENN